MSWTKNNEWLSTNRQTVDWRELRLFLSNLSSRRWELLFALMLSMAAASLVLWVPALIRQMQESLQKRDTTACLIVLASFGGLLIFQSGLNSISRILRSRASFVLNGQLLISYYEKLLRSDIEEYFAFQKRTNLFQRVVDATGITGSFIEATLSVVQQTFSSLILLIVLWKISIPATAVILAGSLILAVGAYSSAGVNRKLRAEVLGLNYPLVGKLLEVLQALTIIKVLSGTLRVTRDVTNLATLKKGAEIREARHDVLWGATSSTGSTLIHLASVAVAVLDFSRGTGAASDVFSVYLMAGWLLPPLNDLARLYHQLASVSVNVKGYHEVMRMKEERRAPAPLPEAASSSSILTLPLALEARHSRATVSSAAIGSTQSGVRGISSTALMTWPEEPAIEFRDVSFAYRGGPPVIQNMSFSIRRGERVSIIGRSGSGKSTVLRVMLGLVTPNSGDVLVNGTPLKDVEDIQLHRNRFGVVTQSDILFEMTLRDNLIFGCLEEVADETIWEALDEVGLRSDVEKLPGKLDEMFNDSMFSGGQRQRISVARALLRKPEFALLDEPTSALDFENEARVLKSMENFTANRTTITVAHRLSTVRAADRILVLEGGRIRNSGTHVELMAQDDYYQSLCKFNSFIL
jgi:ABC-type multidrug transport system fused ATPase/permease subunit